MPNRILLALADRRGFQEFITTRKITREVAYRFVAGETTRDALVASADLKSRGMEAILDYLGENVNSETQADSAAEKYTTLLEDIKEEGYSAHISVKLTQLGLDLSVQGALERMQKICAKAQEVGTTVAIDMESHQYTSSTIDVYRRLREDHDNLVLCLQAYLQRTISDVESLLPLKPSIRLCKGAYNEPKEMLLTKKETYNSYLRLAASLLLTSDYTALATHDEALIEDCLTVAGRAGLEGERLEIQMLYGVRPQLQQRLADEGRRVRIYVPFGDEWYAYLMRRLAERPANLRFFLEALTRG